MIAELSFGALRARRLRAAGADAVDRREAVPRPLARDGHRAAGSQRRARAGERDACAACSTTTSSCSAACTTPTSRRSPRWPARSRPRTRYTSGHTERVADIAVVLADELGFDDDAARRDQRRRGDPRHRQDRRSPTSILLKPGPLDPQEFAEMRRHPEMSSYIVAELELPPVVKQMVRSHHERYDGAGYPDRLLGEEIPLAARILSVADALDAMTSDRPYRKALPLEVARAEIEDKAGTPVLPARRRRAAERDRDEAGLLGGPRRERREPSRRPRSRAPPTANGQNVPNAATETFAELSGCPIRPAAAWMAIWGLRGNGSRPMTKECQSEFGPCREWKLALDGRRDPRHRPLPGQLLRPAVRADVSAAGSGRHDGVLVVDSLRPRRARRLASRQAGRGDRPAAARRRPGRRAPRSSAPPAASSSASCRSSTASAPR